MEGILKYVEVSIILNSFNRSIPFFYGYSVGNGPEPASKQNIDKQKIRHVLFREMKKKSEMCFEWITREQGIWGSIWRSCAFKSKPTHWILGRLSRPAWCACLHALSFLYSHRKKIFPIAVVKLSVRTCSFTISRRSLQCQRIFRHRRLLRTEEFTHYGVINVGPAPGNLMVLRCSLSFLSVPWLIIITQFPDLL